MTNESTGLEHLDDLESRQKLREAFKAFADSVERPQFTWHSTDRTEDGGTLQVMFETEGGQTLILTAPIEPGMPATLCWA